VQTKTHTHTHRLNYYITDIWSST